jgi:NhaA family Na+:H+ antiporter
MPSKDSPARSRPWAASDRPVPRLLVRPLQEFLDTEVAGGVVLLAATVVALLWANSPLQSTYDALWGTELSVRVGGTELSETLRDWMNDGLMTIFFFVVGLEIKRELVHGELREPRRAALPLVAAFGGMVLPALLYLALNQQAGTAPGWGIPMATDIAFALGVVALVGGRAPASVRVFLLSLAIVDDIGAIVVIALFYSGGIELGAVALALALLGVIVIMRVIGVWWVPAYVVVGAAVWLATLASGVHATIAGVALGLLTPAHPLHQGQPTASTAGAAGIERSARGMRASVRYATASVSVTERLQHILHPWASYAIVPLFALSNAGVALGGEMVSAAVDSSVTAGIVLGLVVGKLAGITAFAWVASRLRIVTLPEDLSWRHLAGAGAVAGIGFTVALFIAELAFTDVALVEEAKIGILLASVIASLLGAALFLLPVRRSAPRRT